MVNVNAPFGLRAVGELGSNIQNGGTTEYRINPGLAAAAGVGPIFKGDIVQILANGTIQQSAAGNADCLGVFNGCFYDDPTTQKPTWSNYYPGSITPTGGGLIKAFVYDDPNKLFEIQGSAILAVAAAVGKNTDIVLAQGNTINGQSASQLNTALPPAIATAQLRIVGISTDPENSDPLTANANWIVRINEHVYSRATGV
jgi:hypothetical protein